MGIWEDLGGFSSVSGGVDKWKILENLGEVERWNFLLGQKLNKEISNPGTVEKDGKLETLIVTHISYWNIFSGGTIKSYSKRKLSTDDKINDVDLDDDGLSESKTTVTIQLDPHQQNNPQLFQVIFCPVQANWIHSNSKAIAIAVLLSWRFAGTASQPFILLKYIPESGGKIQLNIQSRTTDTQRQNP